MRAISTGVSIALWVATAVAAFGIGWFTPPPQRPPAADDLVAALRSALGEGDVIERQRRTANLLERLDLDPLPEVAALYERMTPLIDSSELAAFFAAWARFDTLGALDHALSWRLPDQREQREIALRAAIQVWAQRDPAAARLAAEEIGTEIPVVNDTLQHALVTGWAHSPEELEGLAGYLADLPPLQPRTLVIQTVARELVRGGGAEAALGWAEPVLRDEGYEPVFKRSVFKAVAGAAAHWDPERTAAWALEHSGADYATEGVSIVAKQWGRRDGEAALAWVAQQPAGELRDQAVREAFGEWTKTDPLAARAWLVEEKPAALRDPALEFKAKRIVDHEPELALGFCERIEDSARRQGCLESTAKSWYAKDAVATETWLQQSSLDEEARSRVRELTKPNEQRRRGPRRPPIGDNPR
ncbi:MAG: hypothetical protein JRF15_05585 [Deltaproteobacteria bacterium]|jgi:hypothetical protein|nr:hypothetical protein [Deltaproteobacteria bacterium]